ncbi:MAG: aminoglycoside phosphotransferase family protein [Actinomycetia bacterium]|nr:aminoglycoside phosphotransferase family protein [Actinomycetes bacterium]
MQVNDPLPELTNELIATLLGRNDVVSTMVEPLSRHRALLSTVDAVTVTLADGSTIDAVAKRAAADPEGAAAIAGSGAYRRELDLYAGFLTKPPLPAPRLLGVHDPDATDHGAGWVLLLERVRGDEPDQVVGLTEAQATDALDCLAGLHRSTRGGDPPAGARLHPMVGHRQRLETVWPLFTAAFGPSLGPRDLTLVRGVIEGMDDLSAMLGDPAWAVMTHADPRADNLIFGTGPQGTEVVFLDWQQATWQHPAADLAWLAATSMPDIDAALIERLASRHLDLLGVQGQDPMSWFRTGLTWPLSQFVLLASRPASEERRRLLIGATITRIIAAAVACDYRADRF